MKKRNLLVNLLALGLLFGCNVTTSSSSSSSSNQTPTSVVSSTSQTTSVSEVEKEHDVVFTNSENITLSLFKKDGENYNSINKVLSNETVYLKAENASSDRIGIKELNLKYLDLNNEEQNLDVLSQKKVDDYFEIKLGNIKKEEKIAFSITEQGLYHDYGFVGKYFSIPFESDSRSLNIPTDKQFEIDEFGSFKFSNKKYQIKSSTDKKAGVVKAVSEDDKEIEFAFDGKSLITELDFGGKLVCDSMLFSFKIDQESQDYLTDTTEKHYLVDAFEVGGEYVMHDQKDSSKGGIFIVQINSKLKKEIYSTVVVDTKNNFYNLTNTKLEFADEDDDIESSNSTFKIVVENKTYVEIKGTGNYNPKHIILDNLKGEYHLASDLSKTLIINGDGTATYDGETYNYTFENKTVTLKKGLRTDVIELDLENKTYTVTSSVTESPSYIGLTFTAEDRYEYEDNDDYYGGYFVTVTCSISIKFIDANTCEMSWIENDSVYGEETCIDKGTKFSYTLENNIVKITFKFKNSTSKNIELEFSNDYSSMKMKSFSDTFRKDLVGATFKISK